MRFAFPFLLGALLSLSISLGLILALVAFAAVLAVGVVLRSTAALSSALVGFGGSWLVLGTNSALKCTATEDFCGQANFVPLLLVAAAITAVGITAGVAGIARGRRNRLNKPA